jgi:hypothetical protein
MELNIPQPKAAEVYYYSTCADVDQHNRDRQATLKIDTKLQTKDWSNRVNLTIFGMRVVATWKVWSQVTGSKCTQSDFYKDLAEELIDNTYDAVGGTGACRHSSGNLDGVEGSPARYDATTGEPRADLFAHLTPTKKKRKIKDGTTTNQTKQGYCSECKGNAKYNCSLCLDENPNDEKKQKWLCHTETGRDCFAKHMSSCHDV